MQRRSSRRAFMTSALLAAALSACAHLAPDHDPENTCVASIGQFNTGEDLFLAHFDSKPDVDDLHSVAAVGSLLHLDRFACVNAFAVAGAYGTQGGQFIPAGALFDLAFGERWADAHADRDGAVSELAMRASGALRAGGHVWVMEAGQSDVSAAMLRRLSAEFDAETLKTRVHIVQHSEWNETATTPDDLALVRATSDYIKIANGNSGDNGTPDFSNAAPESWQTALRLSRVSPLWREARSLADAHNGATGYDNRSIRAGGLDFSDAVEAVHIFGLDGIEDIEGFFALLEAESDPRIASLDLG